MSQKDVARVKSNVANTAVSRMDISVQAFREILGSGVVFVWPIQRSDGGGLGDACAFPGFHPQPAVRGVLGNPKVRLNTLVRRSKNALAALVIESRQARTAVAGGAILIARAAKLPSGISLGNSTFTDGILSRHCANSVCARHSPVPNFTIVAVVFLCELVIRAIPCLRGS